MGMQNLKSYNVPYFLNILNVHDLKNNKLQANNMELK